MGEKLAGVLSALVLVVCLLLIAGNAGCGLTPYQMLEKGTAYLQQSGEVVYAQGRADLKKRCRALAISKECLAKPKLANCKPWAECQELRVEIQRSFQLMFAGVEAVSKVAPKVKEMTK